MSELRQRREPAPPAATASPAPEVQRTARPRSRLRRCCGCCATSLTLLIALLALGLFGSAIVAGRPLTGRGLLQPLGRINFFFMTLARDLSRAKARRRRFGQENALMPILLGREEPLPLGDPDAGISLTPEELAEYDGRELPGTGGRAPLFLAVKGRIYDVSAGAAFYGPGKSYHKLVGKDASRAFCTGCLQEACLISNLEGLSEAQRREADRWIELYEHHDKYSLVGRLRIPPEEQDPEVEEELVAMAIAAETSRPYKPFKMR